MAAARPTQTCVRRARSACASRGSLRTQHGTRISCGDDTTCGPHALMCVTTPAATKPWLGSCNGSSSASAALLSTPLPSPPVYDVGHSHSPASTPVSLRRCSNTRLCAASSCAPSLQISTRTSPKTDFLVAAALGAGKDEAASPPALSMRRASQWDDTGHEAQSGLRGLQTVAPSSITAWFQSPGRDGSNSCCASAWIWRAAAADPGASARTARNLEITRTTFASTHATGSPKAMDATDAAV